jgi:type IV pilus assembly protein PilB
MKRKNKKLGELLIECGLIKQNELDNALTLQKGNSKRLGKILVELGYINELEVATTLSKQLGLPLIFCNEHTPKEEVLAMIPKSLAQNKVLFPIDADDKELIIAMGDPMDLATISDIAFITGRSKISVKVATESSVLDAIEANYMSSDDTWNVIKEMPTYDDVEFVQDDHTEDEADLITVKSLQTQSEAPPVVKLVTTILVDAVNNRASDVHIEPREKFVQIRYRVDGNLRNILEYPNHMHESVVSRVKIISNLDITNRRLPQDGRSKLRLENRSVDLRISTLPSYYGEKVVIRLLDSATGLINLSKVGIGEEMFTSLIEIISQPQGMILVTGPTGSGKSSTLYSILLQLLTEHDNIITIEDPIEYQIDGLTQVGVHESIGRTFSTTLRSILRQDPDIIMVGEIRDYPTAQIAAQAALTGHMVFSTLHTNNTVATIIRLADIGLEPFMISSALTGILAQRLIRRICLTCKVESSPPDDLIGTDLPEVERYYKGVGCEECNGTGYAGRIGVFELLRLDPVIKRMIISKAQEDDISKVAKEAGMVTLFDDAWTRVQQGITTANEVLGNIPR